MPALNFMKKFAPLVESGEKRQTIRKGRKDGRNPKKGDTLFLYTGMRTKVCRKLKEVICKSSEPITIDGSNIYIGIKDLNRKEISSLSLSDGFPCIKDFRTFFQRNYDSQLRGYLIKW